MADERIAIDGVPHYLARAAGARSGIVLIPHVYGVDEFVRAFADTLAARGLTTIAWNPYPDLPLGAAFTDRPPRPGDRATLSALSRCLETLQSDLGVTDVGTIGFCMGARFVLLFGAHEPRLRAGVACYPSVPAELSPGQELDPVAAAAQAGCPLQLVYPGRDRVTPRPVFERLQAALESRPVATSVLVYPEAEHGFMHSPGAANEAATLRARPQVYAFLDTYLGG